MGTGLVARLSLCVLRDKSAGDTKKMEGKKGERENEDYLVLDIS